MPPRPFQQIDVFTDTPGFGNPLAVVLDAEGLSDEAMQRFARWTHLSETTFVLPPSAGARARGADYRVRIFTPGGELPFAGHPTLGTCHAWLRTGGRARRAGRVVQECQLGLVNIRSGERLAFAAPPLQRSAPSPMLLAKVAAALGLKAPQIAAAQLLDNGPVWLGLLLTDDATVLALRPDHRALKELGQKVGVAGVPGLPSPYALLGRSNREARAFARSSRNDAATALRDARDGPIGLEVRAFAACTGIDEDPVTGSLNASLAQWLIEDGHLPDAYVAGQGQCLGRDGRVFIERDGDAQVWVGGQCVTCIEGGATF